MRKTLLSFRYYLKPFATVLILVGLCCSCKKDRLGLVEETAERIEGTYDLVAIVWEGEPLDVNNDGEASKDLFAELMSLPTNAGNKHQAIVLSLSSDRSTGAVGMDLPMQNVGVTPDGRYPTAWMIGNLLSVNISYQIDSNGIVSVDSFDSMNLPEDDSRVEMKRMHKGTVSFDYNGKMTFRVGYTLYDHQTGQLVDGIIHYIFDRLIVLDKHFLGTAF